MAAELPYTEYESKGVKVFEEAGMEKHRCITLLTLRLLPTQDSIEEEALE